ncbi:MAG: Nif3-like dinuclear metal center hexameric protein [Treponema sp.]|jgi:dinuclear metal center YbgI/SA1388 family protein|nr:Nif3-like dinuclear metal center hexameric protein [Treponema sp.]
MTSAALDGYFKTLLDIEEFAGMDPSMNGIQVDNDGAEIKKIAFAVDAGLETMRRAAGAEMLFVHHGLFWGSPGSPLAPRVGGNHRRRLKFLLDHNICLYAVHLPLDQHPSLGNNAALAALLRLEHTEPFGLYHGRRIGYKGVFPEAVPVEEAVRRISFMERPPAGVFPFGVRKIRSCGVVSGGAADIVRQAMEEGLDLFVTGEASHEVYHDCLEGKINMIAGGHYSTEVWGPRRVMEHCAAELHLDVEFIDIPTGL